MVSLPLARILATHIGTFRIKCPGKPDTVIPDVFWSRDTNVNVLSVSQLPHLNTDDVRLDKNGQLNGIAVFMDTGVSVNWGPPQYMAFRLPHLGPASLNPETKWLNAGWVSSSIDKVSYAYGLCGDHLRALVTGE